MSVYDDGKKDLSELSPKELSDLEDKYSTRKDEEEDEAIEAGANPEELERKGLGRKLRQKGEEDESQDDEELDDRIQSGFESAQEKDEQEGLYHPKGKKKSGRLRKLFRKKSVWAGAGAGIISIIFAISGIIGYLNVFKLGHILGNIDTATFSRFNASFSNRSDKYLKSYINMRLNEIEGSENHDTLLFRANKVDTNNPIKDWYRTLRTSSFEQDVFGKQGIRFQSIAIQDASGGITLRPAIIDFSNRPDLREQFDAHAGATNLTGRKYLTSGALDADLSSFINDLDADSKKSIFNVFDGPKGARKEIKKVVNDSTHFFQVLKRRHIRKDIQNMTGISDWKLFERTRNKYTASKVRLQQKIVRKVIPDTNAGKFIKCVLGAANCTASTDPSAPENRLGGTPAGDALSAADSDQAPTEQLDADGNAIVTTDADGNIIPSTTTDYSPTGTSNEITDIIGNVADEEVADSVDNIVLSPKQSVVAKQMQSLFGANLYTKIWSWAKKIATLHKTILSGKISKLVEHARNIQLQAVYATTAIALSQGKSGELTAEEMGNLMQMFDGAEHSEGWQNLTNSNASAVSAASKYDAPQTTNQTDYCKLTEPERKQQKIQYFCDRPSDSKAAVIEEKYRNSYAFPLIDGIAGAVSAVNESPIGVAINSISAFADNVLGKIIDPIIKASGLGGKLETVIASAMTNVLSFLGAGPMFDGTQAGILNYVTAGSASTAETATRDSGGVVSTAATKVYSNKIAATYLDEESKNQSAVSRFASLDNPKSFASNAMFGLTNLNLGKKLSTIFGSIPSVFTSLFKGTSYAATNNFDAASWAGVRTYDIPQQCQDLEPTDSQYELKTVGVVTDSPFAVEAQKVLDKIRPSLTMRTQVNADEFWQLVYNEIGKKDTAEDIAGAIYNCALQDIRVMGSLGYLYGFSNDGGLGEGSVGLNQSDINCDTVTGNQKIVCAGKTILGVRYANKNEGTGDRWLREWGVTQILGSLGQNPRQWLDERVIGGANDFMECSGYVRTAIYVAYGVTVAAPCSAEYLRDPQFRRINMTELRAGDLLIESETCGNSGHIGIYLGTTDTGTYSSLESSAGVNTEGEKRSGYYERDPSEWRFAVRYIGPGSAL